MVVFTFSLQTGNTLFGEIWSKNVKNMSFKLKFVASQFKYVEFNDGVDFFCFRLKILFWGKFGPKNQNCQFKLKFGS